MSIHDLFAGERRLLGVLGANVGLGGVGGVTRTHQHWVDIMPQLPNILTAVQILVALATLVYMLFKIRRIYRKTDE